MFGKTVQHIEGERFEHALDELKARKGVTGDLDLDAADLEELVGAFQEIVREETGADFPQDPREQLAAAIDAVFSSWNSDRAVLYRRQERIPNELGTAVNVVAMVFGNTGPDSGTGVCFTRDPATGAQGVYGDYLQNAQGEDVVAGIRNTVPLAALEEIDKSSCDELLRIMALLEGHYRDLCDIEFTIERGTLWMLQTRVGKRTAAAAFRIATQLVDEELIDADEAVRRVGAQRAPHRTEGGGKTGERQQRVVGGRRGAGRPEPAQDELLDTGHGHGPAVEGLDERPGRPGRIVADAHVHANLRDRVAQLLAHRLDRLVLNGQAQAGGQYGGRR